MKNDTTLSQVAYLLGCSLDLDKPVANACVDSRFLQPNDLFFALGGERVDGHQFLKQVAGNGASGAVVKADYSGPNYGLTLLRVTHPLEALQKLAKKAIEEFKGKIIAITGSLGKTTTKEFVYALLKDHFSVACTPENYNSQIGLPLTVLNHIKGNEDVAVLEMGMTEPLQIKKLVEIAPPDIGIVTKIALVHAKNFDSIDSIAKAKGEIFSHPKTQKAIVPKDFIYTNSCQVLPHIDIDFPDSFPFLGEHYRYDFILAATCAEALGVKKESIIKSIPNLKLPKRRFEITEKLGVVFVNDSYNSALDSVQAALQSLPLPKKGGKRIAVLSNMVELGKFSEECHRQVGEESLKYVDYMLCLGSDCGPIVKAWKEQNRPVELFETRSELVLFLKQQMLPGDVVLLKGANSQQLWKVLEEV